MCVCVSVHASEREGERKRERECYSFHKEPFGWISVPHTPGAESNVWPTIPSREQRGYQKSDPGGDHYHVGCLGQTPVSLPESLVSDHQ